jgi:hypothetical protein
VGVKVKEDVINLTSILKKKPLDPSLKSNKKKKYVRFVEKISIPVDEAHITESA